MDLHLPCTSSSKQKPSVTAPLSPARPKGRLESYTQQTLQNLSHYLTTVTQAPITTFHGCHKSPYGMPASVLPYILLQPQLFLHLKPDHITLPLNTLQCFHTTFSEEAHHFIPIPMPAWIVLGLSLLIGREPLHP